MTALLTFASSAPVLTGRAVAGASLAGSTILAALIFAATNGYLIDDSASSPFMAEGPMLLSASLMLLGLFAYLLPTVIALGRKHRQSLAIVVLNIPLGWTLLGWVVALVLACIQSQEPKTPGSR